MVDKCFITIPTKPTIESELAKPLLNAISSIYAGDATQDVRSALEDLDKLRKSAVCRVLDRHESSLEVLYRYYDQLNSLEAKIPSAEHQIPFKWKDAFDKGGLFVGRMSLTQASLAFEKICVMFNIGSMLSQIGANQNVEFDDGLRIATRYFQQAAGVFQYVKDHVLAAIQQEPTPDLYPDCLTALSTLMMAQAQEVLFMKAAKEKMKDAVIAKLAAQTEDYYADAMKQMQRDNIRMCWEKDWISIIACKQAGYHAIAEYYQSLVHKANKEIGEELARLKNASELMATARKRFDTPSFPFKYAETIIQRDEAAARKDNDFIYHARIPDVQSLQPIGRASLAKQVPPTFPLSAEKFVDLFGALVPVAIQQSVSAHNTRKADLINREVANLREQTQLMNALLASLNLPAALEDTSGTDVPESVKQKAANIRGEGGIDEIRKVITALPDMLQRNKDILDECNRLLEEELNSDEQLKKQFAERWNRMPSSQLSEPLRTESAKYRAILTNAEKADSIVRDKYQKHERGMTMLSGTNDQMVKSVPSTNPVQGLLSSPVVKTLRDLLDTVKTIAVTRENAENDLKAAIVDIKPKLLQEPNMSAETVYAYSIEELNRVLGPIQKAIHDSFSLQQSIMPEIQRLNSEFCQQKSANKSAEQRETVLKDLAAAYDAYMELKANVNEGAKFYGDLTELLLKFQSKIGDFCFARNAEKEELLRAVQANIINKPTNDGGALKTPSFHEGDGGSSSTKSAPPPRPPPPTTNPGTDHQSNNASASSPSYPPQNPQYPPQNPAGGALPPGYPPQGPPQGYPNPQQQQGGYNPYQQGPPPPNGPYPAYGAYNPPSFNPNMAYNLTYPGAGGPQAFPHGYPQAPAYPYQAPYPQQPGYPQQQQQPGQQPDPNQQQAYRPPW
ncbi:Programmed cell death 6-interacting protein [Hypsibius exemplaris]|uniref:Programmed cell death 6-interacting protein n=1 Tax=Hypsibius exemplaris TaxID=2072580 RepID=A0A9X6RMQ0_HYPEX|nr:Programmed cell death 6-interacting protein [Hypsibius exemplaris]